MSTQDLDALIWGGENIGRAANVVDDNGEVDQKKTFYKLQRGYIPAKKRGDTWISTLRMIRSIAYSD